MTERVFEMSLVTFRKAVALRKTSGGKPVGPIVTDGEPAEFVALGHAGPDLVIFASEIGLRDGPPCRITAVGGLKRAGELSGDG
jgi:hypothetical protein